LTDAPEDGSRLAEGGNRLPGPPHQAVEGPEIVERNGHVRVRVAGGSSASGSRESSRPPPDALPLGMGPRPQRRPANRVITRPDGACRTTSSDPEEQPDPVIHVGWLDVGPVATLNG
jgi:hypothetical protein